MQRRKREWWIWLVLMTAVVALAAGVEIAQAQLPDLVVTSVDGPATGTISSRARIRVSVTLENQGTGNAGAFRLGFYYSTDPTVTTGDVFSGYLCNIDTGLTAGQTVTCNGKIGAPTSLAEGIYYLGACADDEDAVGESNETNNCTGDSVPIVLSKRGRH